jgi:hypothetical protein
MRDQCILIAIFQRRAAPAGFKADEIVNTKMNVNRTICEEVDNISVSLCVLQRETLDKTMMNL